MDLFYNYRNVLFMHLPIFKVESCGHRSAFNEKLYVFISVYVHVMCCIVCVCVAECVCVCVCVCVADCVCVLMDQEQDTAMFYLDSQRKPAAK